MASSAYAVRMVEESRISPPPGSESRPSLPLTFFDIVWVFTPPVSRLYFYHFPHPTAYFVDSFLPNLKSSLSLTLHHFYPFAGNLIRPLGSDDKYEIVYVDGDSVSFTVAEYEGDSHELFGSRNACHHAKVLGLVPRLPTTTSDAKTPLLAVQVTVFPGCGISIGYTIHHAVGDGSCITHFIKSWALACSRLCGSAPVAAALSPPLYDRTLIVDPRGLYSIHLNDMMGIKTIPTNSSSSSSTSQSDDGFLATFTLGKNHIQSLKQWVVAKAAVPHHCSGFVVACAYVWVCIVKTRGYASDMRAHFMFSMDCRGRLRPPIPASYFGNCLRPCYVEVKVGDLVGEDGLLAASEAIGRAIEGFKDGVMDDAEGWVQKLKALISERIISVSGSSKFRVYDIDFGCGRPLKIVIPSIGTTGSISIDQSREEQGGVEIGLVLQEHEMDEFSTRFSDGLKLHCGSYLE